MEREQKSNQLITQKDIKKSWALWHAFCEVSANFERLQGLAYCYSMIPIFKKIYTNKEDLSKALQRHLVMYNTQANWGSIVNGITIALEEQAATTNDESKKNETIELITSLKAGLMGPIAGIGDSLDFGTLRPIVIGICVPFVMQGSVIAALIPLIYQVVYMWITGRIFIKIGYEKGKDSIMNILQSGKVHELIDGFGMFGLFMMGALSSTYVKVTTPLEIATAGGSTIVVQEVLDGIMPCMLSIIVVMAVYMYIKKFGPHYLRILLTIVLGSVALSFVGLL